MREKSTKLVITFPNTSAAMALDSVYTSAMGQGKLIPVPGKIAAGCGLAWCDHPSSEEYLRKIMEEKGIPFSSISYLEMY